MDELTTRNFQALSAGLKEERAKNSDLKIKVDNLEQTLAQLQGQLNAMQSQLHMLLAMSKGHGATSV